MPPNVKKVEILGEKRKEKRGCGGGTPAKKIPKTNTVQQDGFFYRVDTTKPHFVFNSSNKPRVHLVVSTQ